MNIVVSQPMFIPWLGLFEQIKLADVFIHYDDVQLPQGRSMMSRVQIKVPEGSAWLSAPVERARSGPLIADSHFQRDGDWRRKHLDRLRHAYARADHFSEMFDLAERIYAFGDDNVASFNIHAIELIAQYLGLTTTFHRSSMSGVGGSSTERLVNLCRAVGGDRYVTGHGARRYLGHEDFEAVGVEVRYMDYQRLPYSQLHGEFTPFVTILDPIANIGPETKDLLTPRTISWRDLDRLDQPSAAAGDDRP